ncbi:hypothetical protein DY000_02056485 [Brassica cretica]|uniref:glucan endo-1,3-beta-D-glucosidase n=1 Tax=Brassica cretica TaxID=69181 RepID=A0ABQ7AMZ7_BRACR|nr:hypothetical protein DY000_02056485 [Brassica cretica]
MAASSSSNSGHEITVKDTERRSSRNINSALLGSSSSSLTIHPEKLSSFYTLPKTPPCTFFSPSYLHPSYQNVSLKKKYMGKEKPSFTKPHMIRSLIDCSVAVHSNWWSTELGNNEVEQFDLYRYHQQQPRCFWNRLFHPLLVASPPDHHQEGEYPAAQIGVCYGRLGNPRPNPSDVVALYKQLNIKRMRIYDPDQHTLNALRNSNIELILDVPKTDLERIASSQGEAHVDPQQRQELRGCQIKVHHGRKRGGTVGASCEGSLPGHEKHR